MARQRLTSVEFTHGTTMDVDGKRVAVTIVTNQTVKGLDVDEELGIIYVGNARYSIHSSQIRRWTVFAPPARTADKTAK